MYGHYETAIATVLRISTTTKIWLSGLCFVHKYHYEMLVRFIPRISTTTKTWPSGLCFVKAQLLWNGCQIYASYVYDHYDMSVRFVFVYVSSLWPICFPSPCVSSLWPVCSFRALCMYDHHDMSVRFLPLVCVRLLWHGFFDYAS